MPPPQSLPTRKAAQRLPLPMPFLAPCIVLRLGSNYALATGRSCHPYSLGDFLTRLPTYGRRRFGRRLPRLDATLPHICRACPTYYYQCFPVLRSFTSPACGPCEGAEWGFSGSGCNHVFSPSEQSQPVSPPSERWGEYRRRRGRGLVAMDPTRKPPPPPSPPGSPAPPPRAHERSEPVSPPSERSERWGEYRRRRGGGLGGVPAGRG